MSVIFIRFHEDLPTNKQNELRYRMELAAWKIEWRKAEEEQDYISMDWLNHKYELVGLP